LKQYWQVGGLTYQIQLLCIVANLRYKGLQRERSNWTPMMLKTTRRIASVRIHVERVIGVVRQKYTMLQCTIPITLLQIDSTVQLTILKQIGSCCLCFCESVTITYTT
ncbi:hypothetical protein LSH36_1426g00007, partial [Paralvinella palmiformis]